MSIIKRITNSTSMIAKPLNFLIFRFINNNLYEINKVIRIAQLVDNNQIFIELNNGDKYYFTSYKANPPINLLNKITYSDKKKTDKILNYERFFFIYDLIEEVYVKGSHFNQIDYLEFGTIIDAGANIGAFTINANRSKKDCNFILVEPEEKNIIDLKKNLDANKVENYVVVKKGIWSKEGKMSFFTSNRAGEHSLVANDNSNEVTIDVTKLESIFEENKISDSVLIKMDIEGAELEVITSSIEFLKNRKNTTLLIEALHFVEGKETYKTLIPLLKENGFDILDWGNDFRGTILAKN
ncbi:MAG: FkbM family methyltransferase [Candidatus Kapaibacterium sp.]|nr:FkbM family methyltransferase [Ignavibacteriota bacterium]MCB9222425.1 FkbM family methyltransferase [Ignavibacteria bacterium]